MISAIIALFQIVSAIEYGHPNYSEAYMMTAGKKISSLFVQEDLLIYGSGGAFCDKISRPHYSVFSSKKMEQEEAVQYYLKVFNTVLLSINNSKEIRFYLHEYPLTDQSLGIWMSFGEQYGKKYSYPYVSSIFNSKGCLVVVYLNDEGSEEGREVEIPFEVKLTK